MSSESAAQREKATHPVLCNNARPGTLPAQIHRHSSPAATAQTFHQYGYTQYKLRDFDEALRWFEKAAVISRERNLERVLSYVLHDSALIYQSRSKFNEAIPLLERFSVGCKPARE
jgi:tetratricopeptide (TPR) repeat protein